MLTNQVIGSISISFQNFRLVERDALDRTMVLPIRNWGDNTSRFYAGQGKIVRIAGDEVISVSGYGCFEKLVIVGVRQQGERLRRCYVQAQFVKS